MLELNVYLSLHIKIKSFKCIKIRFQIKIGYKVNKNFLA